MQLLDHVSITVRDPGRAKPSYLAVMSALGAGVASERPGAIGFGQRNRPNDNRHSDLGVFESPAASESQPFVVQC